MSQKEPCYDIFILLWRIHQSSDGFVDVILGVHKSWIDPDIHKFVPVVLGVFQIYQSYAYLISVCHT